MDLSSLMGGGAPAPAGPAGPTGPAAAPAAPPSAPAGPMANAGNIASARLKVVLARKLLETALPEVGAETDEGKALVLALRPLCNIFIGEASPGMLDSEVQSLQSTATPSPQPAPGAGAPGAAPAGPAPAGMPMTGPRPAFA